MRDGAAPSWPALERVKCWCVVGMVLIHSFYWVATERGHLLTATGGWLWWAMRGTMFVGFFPLLLPFTAGAVLRLQLGSATNLPRPSWATVGKVALGGGVLTALGFAMNVAATGGALWAWNVLQFVGLSFALLALLLRLGGVGAVWLAGLVVLAATPWLPAPLSHWTGPYWHAILFGDEEGYHVWPFFPWFSTIVAGFAVSHVHGQWRAPRQFVRRLAGLALGCTAVALALGQWLPPLDPADLIGEQLFRAPIGMVLGLLGFAGGAILLAEWLAARHPLPPRGFVNCFSKGILWIYLIHTVVGCRLAAALQDGVASGDWTERFPPLLRPVAMLAFPLLLLALSWGVGYLAIRLLHETRIHFHLRRVPRPA